MPFVLGDETQPGIIASGNEVKGKDPVRAWTEFVDVGRRMAKEGTQIVEPGAHTRTNILTSLQASD